MIPGPAIAAALAAIATALATAGPAAAFGEDGIWTRGTGDMACEAMVTAGPENSIYVTCTCSDLPPGVLFTVDGADPGGSVSLSFDGAEPVSVPVDAGALWADCDTCQPDFPEIVAQLRRFNSVDVQYEDGAAATFSLRGSSAALQDCTAAPETAPGEN